MNGQQLTFYTAHNRKHGHLSVADWLLREVWQLGIHGATVIDASEGVGHAGSRHAAHALNLADQPVQIIVAVTDDEAKRLLDVVRSERVHVFYTSAPIEFGVIGDRGSQAGKHFALFKRKPH